MDMESLLGGLAASTLVATSRINGEDMVNLSGLMELLTEVSGMMEFSQE